MYNNIIIIYDNNEKQNRNKDHLLNTSWLLVMVTLRKTVLFD